MAERDAEKKDRPNREETDESLRAEREKSDRASVEKQSAIERKADSVVRVARARADEVLQAARDDADREQMPSASAEATAERERAEADVILAHERARADEVLERERLERREYFRMFLGSERDATDANLTDERAEADTMVAVRDDFLATVSHDLRSLLGGLSLTSQLLFESAPEGAAGDTTRKRAATSQRLVVRMSRLVGDLLDIASIQAGKVAIVLEESDVTAIIRDTFEAFEPMAAAKGVALVVEPALLPTVERVDSGRILQVLANLVSNAIKFTPPGGRVSLEVTREETELSFAVRDTGVGIAADAVKDVFEKYKQVAQDRRGLGLGLYISKGIVEAHGGRLWVESQPGVGSAFLFAIPRAEPRP